MKSIPNLRPSGLQRWHQPSTGELLPGGAEFGLAHLQNGGKIGSCDLGIEQQALGGVKTCPRPARRAQHFCAASQIYRLLSPTRFTRKLWSAEGTLEASPRSGSVQRQCMRHAPQRLVKIRKSLHSGTAHTLLYVRLNNAPRKYDSAGV